MLYRRKGFLLSFISIFIQNDRYQDYSKITQKSFADATREDITAISEDYLKALNSYIAEVGADLDYLHKDDK